MPGTDHIHRIHAGSAGTCNWIRCSIAISVLALPASGSLVRAQDVTELSLKAAVVYNLAKFVDWPPEAMPATGPFTACVLGDDAAADTLARIVKGRLVGGKSIKVVRVRIDGPLKTCHLLYVPRGGSAQLAAILAGVRDAPVLTISDIHDFSALGGVAELFVENGRIRFNVNLDAARRSRVHFSSDVLALAAQVRGAPGGDK